MFLLVFIQPVKESAASLLVPGRSWSPSARANETGLAGAGPSRGERPVGNHAHGKASSLNLRSPYTMGGGHLRKSSQLREGGDQSCQRPHPTRGGSPRRESDSGQRAVGSRYMPGRHSANSKAPGKSGIGEGGQPCPRCPRGVRSELHPCRPGPKGQPRANRAGPRPRAVKRFALQVDGRLLPEF